MKFFSLLALVATLSFLLPGPAFGAAVKSSPDTGQTVTIADKQQSDRKVKRQESSLKRLKKKLEKRTQRLLNGSSRNYLFMSLGLLGAAILFLALSGPAGIFNVIGAIAFIAAVTFFVIWLLKFRRGTFRTGEEGPVENGND